MSNDETPTGSIIKRNLDGIPGVVYSHVGIYAGEGRVIHFDGVAFGDHDARVREVDLSVFTKGRSHRVSAKPKSTEHGEAIVGEARRLLGDPSTWDGSYNFAFRNCEDFAQHCFRAEYSSAKGSRKERAPWSQRLRTIAASVGTAVIVVATQVVTRRRRGPGA